MDLLFVVLRTRKAVSRRKKWNMDMVCLKILTLNSLTVIDQRYALSEALAQSSWQRNQVMTRSLRR